MFRLFLAEEQIDDGSVQVPILTNLVLEITLVGVPDPLRQVAEEDEGGHMGTLEHGDVLDLDIFSLHSGGRIGLDVGLQHVVEL